jgi:integrase
MTKKEKKPKTEWKKFSEKWIQTLKPGEIYPTYRNIDFRPLHLEVTKRKVTFKVRPKGRTWRRLKTDARDVTLEEAYQWAIGQLSEGQKAILSREARGDKENQSLTILKAIRIEGRRRVNLNQWQMGSIDSRISTIKRFTETAPEAKKCIKDIKLDRLFEQLDNYRTARGERPAQNTMGSMLEALKVALDYAYSVGIKLDMYKFEQEKSRRANAGRVVPRKSALGWQGYLDLWAWLHGKIENNPCYLYRAQRGAIALAMILGVRAEVAARLSWSDVHDSHIRIHNNKYRAGKEPPWFDVPKTSLLNYVIAFFGSSPEASPWVFPSARSTSKHVSKGNLRVTAFTGVCLHKTTRATFTNLIKEVLSGYALTRRITGETLASAMLAHGDNAVKLMSDVDRDRGNNPFLSLAAVTENHYLETSDEETTSVLAFIAGAWERWHDIAFKVLMQTARAEPPSK